MPNRTAKFVSALIASFLAGAPLTTVSYGAADPADECLSGPKGQTPQGSHWYYRVDRGTKRHCWYLADQREPLSQSAAPNPSASAKPPQQDAEGAMQTSVANAHAELPAQGPVELTNRSAEIAPTLSADAVHSEDHDNAATPPGMSSQRSLVASRWPDSYSAEPSINPEPSKHDPGTNVNPVARTQPTSVLTAGQFAAADLSSQTPSYPAQMQLAALMGMLALAGIIGTVIFKFGGSRQLQPSQIRKQRGPIWESTDDDRIVLSRHPAADSFAHGLNRSTDRSERIAEFFAQISGRAPM
jgi:hypothetical protein